MSFLGIGTAPAATPWATAQNVNTAAGATADTFKNKNQDADRAALSDFYNRVMAQNGPQGTASTAGPAAQAAGAQVAPATQAQAASAGAAAQAAAANAGQATNANAAMAGPAALSNHATINTANNMQDRAQQQALNSSLSGIANGTHSGLGQLQFQQNQAANIAAANAAAQSGRTGQNAQLVARNLQSNLANQNSAAGAQSAQLAMQEQAQARQELAGNLGTMAGTDANLATNQAGLQQQTALANQGALNTQSQFNAANAQQVALQNANAANQMAATNAGYQQSANLANMGAANQQNQYNTSNAQQIALANQAAANAAAAQQAGLTQQNQQYNAGAINTQGQFNANLGQNMTLANMQAAQANQQLQAQAGLSALGATNNLDQQAVNNQISGLQAQQAQQQITNNFNQGQASMVMGPVTQAIGGAGVGLAALSDKKQKKKIKSAHQMMNELLDKMCRVSDENLKKNITTSFLDSPFGQIKPAVIPAPAVPGSNSAVNAAGVAAGKALGKSLTGPQTNADLLNAGMTQPGGPGGTLVPSQFDANAAFNTPEYLTPGMGATAGMPLVAGEVSDERQKDDKRSVSQALSDMLDKLTAYQYEYKDPTMPGAGPGKHLGVMAQDLEKSPAGQTFVHESPEGHKVVAYGEMLPALLASMAVLHKRTKALEAR
jgi:hypothetical protein